MNIPDAATFRTGGAPSGPRAHGFSGRWLLIISLAVASSPVSMAQVAEPDPKATLFANAYLSLCMKHVNDFEPLRAELEKQFPQFLPAQAAGFLKGRDGSAWPIVSSLGNFAIVLPQKVKVCELIAQKADPRDVDEKFMRLVAQAPAPLISEKRSDESRGAPGGTIRTMAYVWKIPGANTALMFVLTTTTQADAQIQAFASATVIAD